MERPNEATTSSEVAPAKPAAAPPKRFVRNQVPDSIMNDSQLSDIVHIILESGMWTAIHWSRGLLILWIFKVGKTISLIPQASLLMGRLLKKKMISM